MDVSYFLPTRDYSYIFPPKFSLKVILHIIVTVFPPKWKIVISSEIIPKSETVWIIAISFVTIYRVILFGYQFQSLTPELSLEVN